MLEGGSSPPSPGSECGPAAAAAEEETKDNEGQVYAQTFLFKDPSKLVAKIRDSFTSVLQN